MDDDTRKKRLGWSADMRVAQHMGRKLRAQAERAETWKGTDEARSNMVRTNTILAQHYEGHAEKLRLKLVNGRRVNGEASE